MGAVGVLSSFVRSSLRIRSSQRESTRTPDPEVFGDRARRCPKMPMTCLVCPWWTPRHRPRRCRRCCGRLLRILACQPRRPRRRRVRRFGDAPGSDLSRCPRAWATAHPRDRGVFAQRWPGRLQRFLASPSGRLLPSIAVHGLVRTVAVRTSRGRALQGVGGRAAGVALGL